MAYQQFGDAPWAQPWIQREREIAPRWIEAIRALSTDAAVAIVSFYKGGPAAMEAFAAQAEAALGARCITLREPDWLHPDFWSRVQGDEASRCLRDLRDACLTQGEAWNKEEMTTLFHARSCSIGLLAAMRDRGLTMDISSVECEGWGEEFEGCTLKYALAFRRALDLKKPVELDFDRCVAGAKFALKAKRAERISLSEHLRLFLFDSARGAFAIFMSTQNTLANRAENVRLPRELSSAHVRAKQGLFLWPKPTISRRKTAPLGLHEPEQPLVYADDHGLVLPVCTGVIYRLAKAPAYIFAPRGMSRDEFRHLLMQAKPV